jgi:hypothetical protein
MCSSWIVIEGYRMCLLYDGSGRSHCIVLENSRSGRLCVALRDIERNHGVYLCLIVKNTKDESKQRSCVLEFKKKKTNHVLG